MKTIGKIVRVIIFLSAPLIGVLFYFGYTAPHDPNREICEMTSELIKKQIPLAGESFRSEGPCFVYPHGDVHRVRYGYSTFITRRDNMPRMHYEVLIAKRDTTYFLCSWRLKTSSDVTPLESIHPEVVSKTPACLSVWNAG